MPRHKLLFLALVAGAAFGALLHPYAGTPWLAAVNTHALQPLGQIFLRLIFMAVVPLVFSALVLGVHSLGAERGLGKVASRTLLYTVVCSSLSVLIGVGLVNAIRPGEGFRVNPETLAEQASAVGTISKNAKEAQSFSQAIVELVPKNPVDTATRALSGEMLQLMVFALIFGVALAMVGKRSDKAGPLVPALEQLFDVSMKIVDFAMRLAPAAVFAIVFGTVFKLGHGILESLLYFALTVVAGLLVQQLVVYPVLLKTVARRSPWEFFSKSREVYLTAFSTASSNATLPQTIETAETKLGLPPRIARFVLTVGSTANQNGTALFEGVTVLFLAQVYGIDLSFDKQVYVVLMAIVAGIGTAGVPGGSLPVIMILLQSVGIPPEGLGLILGADRLLDMCRTTLNVSGDLVITALVSAGEEEGVSKAKRRR